MTAPLSSNLQFSIAEVIECLERAPFYEQRGLHLGVDVAICAVRYMREVERLRQYEDLNTRLMGELDWSRGEIERLQNELKIQDEASEILTRRLAERSADETSARLTDAQCDEVISQLEDYEWTGLTRDNVRTWDRVISEMRATGENHSTAVRTGAHRASGETDSAGGPSPDRICEQPEAAHGDGCRSPSDAEMRRGLATTMERVYNRLQCADVPRDPWHAEVSELLLYGCPRDRASLKASGDYCLCGNVSLAKGQQGRYYCKTCGKDLDPGNYSE